MARPLELWFDFASTYSYVAAMRAEAASPEKKSLLRANTDAAMARGIFGAPSCFVGDELFFGQDRFADALAWAARLE